MVSQALVDTFKSHTAKSPSFVDAEDQLLNEFELESVDLVGAVTIHGLTHTPQQVLHKALIKSSSWVVMF